MYASRERAVLAVELHSEFGEFAARGKVVFVAKGTRK